jgi:hypothetical protein
VNHYDQVLPPLAQVLCREPVDAPHWRSFRTGTWIDSIAYNSSITNSLFAIEVNYFNVNNLYGREYSTLIDCQ